MTTVTADPIPLVLLDYADPELLEEALTEVARIASTGAFTLGAEVEAFESEFATFCGTDHAIGVSSGTESLHLAFRALGIGPGDEVIVPANSFIATAEAVSLAGATPRLVDVDEDTQLLTPDIVRRALTPRIKAVALVHLFGRTGEAREIAAVAREAGIALVEDCAQAHGAACDGARAGAIGDIGCFSFYPTKNLGAWGDAGAATTNDPALAERMRLLRSHGEQPRYHHRMVGTTARLDALQAAVLRVKLRRLEDWNTRRRELAARLTDGLAGLPGVTVPAPVRDGGDHVYHLYVVRCADRDGLRRALGERGIASAVHYPFPISSTEAYASLGTPPLPASERLAGEILSLPLHPHLTDADADRIVAAVRDVVEGQSTPSRSLGA